MRCREMATVTVAVITCGAAAPAVAEAEFSRTVQPGETLSWVASVNGVTPSALAAANGLPVDAQLVAGQQMVVPSPAAVAAPVAEATEIAAPPAPPPADPATAVAQGMVPIHHPSTTPYLAPGAAASWEAMRQESLAVLGVDLYPTGALSAYRTYEQQAYFWDLYQAGQGNPASPPGGSNHETGLAVDVPTPQMRDAIDQLGARYGWVKTEAPTEWWHVNYVGG